MYFIIISPEHESTECTKGDNISAVSQRHTEEWNVKTPELTMNSMTLLRTALLSCNETLSYINKFKMIIHEDFIRVPDDMVHTAMWRCVTHVMSKKI